MLFTASRRVLIPGLLLLLVLLPVGCSRYGEVSPRAYQISTSLYSICNRKDGGRLETVEKLIASSLGSDEISSSESEWLLDIVEKAKSSDWTGAMQDARVMMMDQVDQ